MARAGGKREALVAAAKALLWEQGFEATSPRDVMARAEAGQGSLYHHFPGKLDLAAAALDEMAAEEMAAIDALFAPSRPPLDRVRAPVAAYVAHIRGHLAASLAAAKARGHLPATLDPEALASALLAVVEGGYVLARVRWDEAAMEEAVEGGLQLLTAVSRPG